MMIVVNAPAADEVGKAFPLIKDVVKAPRAKMNRE